MACNYKKKKLSLNKKGSVSYFVVFVALALILLFLFAVITPALILMNTQLYSSAESMFEDAIEGTADIKDANIRTSLETTFTTAKDTIPTQAVILSDFFQFGFIIIIIFVIITLFMLVRANVEKDVLS